MKKVILAASVALLAIGGVSGCSMWEETKEKAVVAAVDALPDNARPTPDQIKMFEKGACKAGDIYLSLDAEKKEKALGAMRLLNEKLAPIANQPELSGIANQLIQITEQGAGVQSDVQKAALKQVC